MYVAASDRAAAACEAVVLRPLPSHVLTMLAVISLASSLTSQSVGPRIFACGMF